MKLICNQKNKRIKLIFIISLLIFSYLVFYGFICFDLGIKYIHFHKHQGRHKFPIIIDFKDSCSIVSKDPRVRSELIRNGGSDIELIYQIYGVKLREKTISKIIDGYDAILVLNGSLISVYKLRDDIPGHRYFGNYDVTYKKEDIGKCKLYFFKHEDDVWFDTIGKQPY